MGKKDKLINRLKSKPKDFTFEEAESLLGFFAYERSDKGKTSGSRVVFKNQKHPPILLHKPHPGNELKSYQVKQLVSILEQEGLI
ncbi:MAG: type II toxin-antitoxin system HicA family toxin [Lachnospiraceae bacterium]|nr:type II toxin-antitoxin system HicA family toxin [Lachnospiraceae bacterium]